MVIIEVLGLAGSSKKGGLMALIRLKLHEHPAPPHHEIRQKSVLDSGGTVVGMVANLYVDEDGRQLRFVDVLTSDFLGLERHHHLVPMEVVSLDRSWIDHTKGEPRNRGERAGLPEPPRGAG